MSEQLLNPEPPLVSVKRPVRILHLVTTLNTGGLERVVLDLTKRSNRSYFDIQVACLDHSGDLGPEFESLGVTPYSLNLMELGLLKKARLLAQFLRKLRPDILHTHNSGPHLIGSLAALFARTSVLVHTKHGRNYVDRPKMVIGNRIASHLSSHVVAVSEDAASVARNIEKAPHQLVSVIHNGVDLQTYGYEESEHTPSPIIDTPEYGRAVHVARLNRVKDQPTLLRAAKIASCAEPNFSLDIVGDGPDGKNVKSLHSELNLDEQVKLHGMRNDVPTVLRQSDYFVLTSLSEGISLTLLEAMAAGLAVIATDVGGNREVVVHEETGFLVPPRDPEAIAQAMLRLTRDPALARRMGAAGRNRVKQCFDLADTVSSYEKLYRDLLGSKLGRKRRAKYDSATLSASTIL